MLIVDDALERLALFGPGGAWLEPIGRPGRGPGEFEQPRAVTRLPDGAILVAEGVRLQRFNRSGAGYEFAQALPLDVPAQDICAFGDTVVSNGSRRNDPVVHLYAANGDTLRAFGAVYHSPNEMINEEMGVGQVACDQVDDVIAFATRGPLGEVRGFRPDGTMLWRTVLHGVRANQIEDAPGGYRVTRSVDGVHSLFSLITIPGRGFLLQWTFRTPEELAARASYGKILTFLLDPATGHALGPDSTLPPILAATDTTILVSTEEPEPRFEIRRLLPPMVVRRTAGR